MRDVLGPGTVLGYCTNVHAGATYSEMRCNLERFSLAVKRIVSPHQPMGVGLWFSAQSAGEIIAQGRISELADWLNEHGLLAYTLNGFPYGDFHQPVVKHAVYEPDWSTPERLAYTLDLAKILSQLLPEGAEGSISTLPLGWPCSTGVPPVQNQHSSGKWNTRDARSTEKGTGKMPVLQKGVPLEPFSRALQKAAEGLHQLESDTGRYVHLNLEPEPGCLLDTAEDVIRFFEDHLLSHGKESLIRRHLGVCHDICHSAVMFEYPSEALARYHQAGIRVDKVQISSAVRVPFDRMTPTERLEATRQLHNLHEPRYLHQTTVRTTPLSNNQIPFQFYDDLPQALTSAEPSSEWRIHFHVPVFVEKFGHLETTNHQIKSCLEAAWRLNQVRHFEVETYAWNVLPKELKTDDLAVGIAQELLWVKSLFGTGS